jgi:hypothetical protein
MSRTIKVWKKDVFKGPPPGDGYVDAEDCLGADFLKAYRRPLPGSVTSEQIITSSVTPATRSVYLDPRGRGSGVNAHGIQNAKSKMQREPQ